MSATVVKRGIERTRSLRVSLTRIRVDDVISLLLLLGIVLLVGGNTDNPDIDNYYSSYIQNAQFSLEGVLFYLASRMGNFLHLDFHQYRLTLYVVGYFVIWRGLSRMNARQPLFFISYAIALMLMDSTQTSNFVAMALLFSAISRIAVNPGRTNYLAVLELILASGFHISFLVYFATIPLSLWICSKGSHRAVPVFIAVTAFACLFDAGILSSLLQRILSAANLNSYLTYLSARTRYGHLLPIALHLLCCSYLSVCYMIADHHQLDGARIIGCLLAISLSGVFVFPLFRFQLTMARLTRNLELLAFSGGAITCIAEKDIRIRIGLRILLLLLSLALGYFTVFADFQAEIVEPFFFNNWLLWG